MTRITRLMVANRGEIARRIFRTCREMGIGTVAVYAEPDADAPFVREADLAVTLGGNTSAETYLDIEKLIFAARRSGADAVHPGYGFLSENAAFARAVIDAGLTWVGPRPDAIGAMGDKLAAKRLMEHAGVPILRGIEIQDGPVAEALEAPAAPPARPGAVPVSDRPGASSASATGLTDLMYPVLVKAAGGGGGRGMRIVRDPAQLANAIASARREAQSAFGNGTVFLERYLERARHIEVQVFGDSKGSLVHLFERECSIQRRHQKIIEEAPSAAVSPGLRARLGAAAIAAARTVNYDNAGTVEFMLEEGTGEFFFLEMNTRLQVEHPVTEAITGLDLVREQIRVAESHPLSFTQESLQITGHAIEARLYAEDPRKDFLPAPGRLLAFAPDPAVPVRWDSGVESGSEVSVYFDPMLAKVIAHAPTRDEAAMRLALALERLQQPGLTTNRDFLVGVLRNEAFLGGDTTTDFIDRIQPARERVASTEELTFAALAAALTAQSARIDLQPVLRTLPSGWRNNPSQFQKVAFAYGDAAIVVEYLARSGGRFDVRVGEAAHRVTVHGQTLSRIDLDIDGLRRRVTVRRDGDRWFTHDGAAELELVEQPRFPERGGDAHGGGYESPMPGKVVEIRVATGDAVREGQLLLIVEAMKMEHHINCTKAGTVTEIRVTPGQQVEGGAVLLVIEAARSEPVKLETKP